MFTGTDGMGNHARIQIVDEAKRKELFGLGDTEVSAPILLNEESVKELLAIRSKAKFNEQLEAMVKTDAEKRMLVELAFSVGAEDAESWKVDALRKLAETAQGLTDERKRCGLWRTKRKRPLRTLSKNSTPCL